MKLLYISIWLFLFAISSLFAQWEKVKNIPPPYDKSYWLEMYFLPDKPNYGWVCGYDGKVLRTTDMGATWTGTMIRGAYQLEHIHFVDEKVGFTSGIGSNGFGKIYKTTDGGATWFDITPNRAEDLWGHWFVDRDYGVVIGGGCITPQRFFLTTNGGNSWDYVTEINYLPNSGLTDVIIYSRWGLGYATSSGYIWKTTDGGRSWQIFSRTGNNDWQEDLWISGNTIIVPYSTGCGGDGGSGGVRSSKDLGKSWKQFSTGTSMFGAFLHDSLRGWVCGWDRAVYYTSDGGDTWTLLNCGIDPGVDLDDFWFINDTLGWVVGDGIYKFVG
ncbi:MAG: WD40/YVTN/BNR-like repeat-containing protein, partial [Candidatus Kapaibacteriota bacterium]